MKNPVQNKFTYLRKSIVSILASNAFKAAICMLLSLALFACSSDTPIEKSNEITDTEVNNPSQKPEAPEVPDYSETPDTPENPDNPNTSEEPEEPGRDPEEPEKPDEPQPDDPESITLSEEEREAALKNIFGIAEASEEMSDTITLTAQAIKVLGDISSGSYMDGIEDKDIKSAVTNDPSAIAKIRETYGVQANNSKEIYTAIKNGIVTRDETDYELKTYGYYQEGVFTSEGRGWVGEEYPIEKTVPSYKVSSTDKQITLDGDFYYNDMHVELGEKTSIGNNYRISLKQKYENYPFVMTPEAVFDAFSNAVANNPSQKDILTEGNYNVDKLPTLDFQIHHITEVEEPSNIHTHSIIALYKAYGENDNKLNITYDKDKIIRSKFNGKEIIDSSMFNGNEETKEALTNISADTLVKASKYVSEFANLKITDKYNTTESEDINAKFTNVIFEEDVSGIRNSADDQFNGVVYFKDNPYDITRGSTVNFKGILKLDVLTDNMNSNTFDIHGFAGGQSSVIDVRNVKETDLNNYNVLNPILTGGSVNAIYYPDDVNEELVENINKKFADEGYGGFIRNAYSNNSKIYTYVSSQNNRYASSKTPRSLEEFEYFGNNGQFKKSAYDTYENNFDGLTEQEIKELKEDNDSGSNQIALNDKKIDFIDPETKKIIFSILNDLAINNKIKTRAAYI